MSIQVLFGLNKFLVPLLGLGNSPLVRAVEISFIHILVNKFLAPLTGIKGI